MVRDIVIIQMFTSMISGMVHQGIQLQVATLDIYTRAILSMHDV